jgi:hypothetical protein
MIDGQEIPAIHSADSNFKESVDFFENEKPNQTIKPEEPRLLTIKEITHVLKEQNLNVNSLQSSFCPINLHRNSKSTSIQKLGKLSSGQNILTTVEEIQSDSQSQTTIFLNEIGIGYVNKSKMRNSGLMQLGSY